MINAIDNIESNRIYYVFFSKEEKSIKSGFIFGKRKVTPWKRHSEDLSNLFEEDYD